MKAIKFLPLIFLAGVAFAQGTNVLMSGLDLKVAPEVVPGDNYPTRTTRFPRGVTGYSDVVIATNPGSRPITMDIYKPRGSGNHPVILYVHGGGWMGGHSRASAAIENFPHLLASVAARGYVVASVNYRLSSEAKFPAQIDDVKAAIRFLRAKASTYGVDKNKFGIWGGSAGGHLITLAATTCGHNFGTTGSAVANANESDCLNAAVGWYSVTDFTAMGERVGGAVDRLIGCGIADCRDKWVDASPITHVDASDPPMLLIHGDKDAQVPFAQSVMLGEKMNQVGASAVVKIIPNADHSWIGANPQSTSSATIEAVNATINFFDSKLKN